MPANQHDPEHHESDNHFMAPGERADTTPSPTLQRAAAAWIRRGYVLRYEDAHLIQLVRKGRPTCLGLLLIGLAAPTLLLALILAIQGLRRRHWHTVSITVTPDRRVITHRQWTPYPPEA